MVCFNCSHSQWEPWFKVGPYKAQKHRGACKENEQEEYVALSLILDNFDIWSKLWIWTLIFIYQCISCIISFFFQVQTPSFSVSVKISLNTGCFRGNEIMFLLISQPIKHLSSFDMSYIFTESIAFWYMISKNIHLH